MESVTRNVKDIDSADRLALEHVLGQPLSESQQVVIHVQPLNLSGVSVDPGQPLPATPSRLPAWCNVYEGLSDAEVAEIEQSIVRNPGSRSSQ
jgi:hypothetical protein